jgi:hypothetical protein
MNCPWCETWLQRHWDGTAPAYPPPELSRHWEASPACRQRFDLVGRCQEVLPASSSTLPSPQFADQVLARVGRERFQSRVTAWVTTVAAVLLAGFGLTWTMLNGETSTSTHAPMVLQSPSAVPTAPPSQAERLAQMRQLVEPLEGATDRTLTMTKQMANRAEEKFRKIMPDFELTPAEDAWTASVLPVRVVGDAASAGFDPLATSTKEAYETVKQYMPSLPKRKVNGGQM